MGSIPGYLRQAYRLYRTDDSRDTLVAAAIFVVVAGWVEFQTGIGRRLFRSNGGES